MASQVVLITGASTGFGALAARALAKAGHTGFAGMYSHSGDTRAYEDEITAFSNENNVHLHPVALDLLDQTSVNAAVQHVLSKTNGRLDAVVHNAGHMCFGPAEAFTAEQLQRLYDVNVAGAQRLNQAALPHLRAQRSGHLIWISSASVYGAKPPFLAGYFAAKAAMDSLAQSYALELTPWGIESTIVNPGVFTRGTNHFADAMHPSLVEVEKEYEDGPCKGLAGRTRKGLADLVPEDADPVMVADALVELVGKERGKKPFRVFVDAADGGCAEAAPVVDRNVRDNLRRMDMYDLLKIRT